MWDTHLRRLLSAALGRELIGAASVRGAVSEAYRTDAKAQGGFLTCKILEAQTDRRQTDISWRGSGGTNPDFLHSPHQWTHLTAFILHMEHEKKSVCFFDVFD